jgi:hypothetical protein
VRNGPSTSRESRHQGVTTATVQTPEPWGSSSLAQFYSYLPQLCRLSVRNLDQCGVSLSFFVSVLQPPCLLPPTSSRNHLQLDPGEKEKPVMGQPPNPIVEMASLSRFHSHASLCSRFEGCLQNKFLPATISPLFARLERRETAACELSNGFRAWLTDLPCSAKIKMDIPRRDFCISEPRYKLTSKMESKEPYTTTTVPLSPPPVYETPGLASRVQDLMNTFWVYEILASLLSLVMLAAIFGVLHHYNSSDVDL